MAIAAWVFGILGGLCAVMGILTAVEIAPSFIDPAWATWVFWFGLGGILLIGCIAASISRSTYE